MDLSKLTLEDIVAAMQHKSKSENVVGQYDLGMMNSPQIMLTPTNMQSTQTPKYMGMDLYARYFGKYVICRSRSEGVNAGEVIAADATGVILKDARRLYYHKPVDKNMSWYEGVAMTGLSEDSLVGPAVEKIIVEDYSLTLCSPIAMQSIKSAPTNKQS